MWSQRVFYLGLTVLSILGGAIADQTIVVDAQDERITYDTHGFDPEDQWQPIPASSSSCDTPQMLTEDLSDFMSFTFEGTGVSVIGTTGPRQGIIQFSLDGVYITTIDRGRPRLECDEVIYELSNLDWGQHTIEGELVGQGINPDTGETDGVFSVQRIKYTIPNDSGPDSSGPDASGPDD